MTLNHVNLSTSDVARAASLFVDHFGFAPKIELKTNLAVLAGKDGFILTLMRPGKKPVAYPPSFHVGFYLDTSEAVHAKRAELAASGWAPGAVEDLVRGGFASTTFYCPLTDGILVEVSAMR